jgi:hypothetical protein
MARQKFDRVLDPSRQNRFSCWLVVTARVCSLLVLQPSGAPTWASARALCEKVTPCYRGCFSNRRRRWFRYLGTFELGCLGEVKCGSRAFVRPPQYASELLECITGYLRQFAGVYRCRLRVVTVTLILRSAPLGLAPCHLGTLLETAIDLAAARAGARGPLQARYFT